MSKSLVNKALVNPLSCKSNKKDLSQRAGGQPLWPSQTFHLSLNSGRCSATSTPYLGDSEYSPFRIALPQPSGLKARFPDISSHRQKGQTLLHCPVVNVPCQKGQHISVFPQCQDLLNKNKVTKYVYSVYFNLPRMTQFIWQPQPLATWFFYSNQNYQYNSQLTPCTSQNNMWGIEQLRTS